MLAFMSFDAPKLQGVRDGKERRGEPGLNSRGREGKSKISRNIKTLRASQKSSLHSWATSQEGAQGHPWSHGDG